MTNDQPVKLHRIIFDETEFFLGGVMTVPLVLKDEVFGPPVKDTATLVAGIAGFKVAEGDKRPVVEAQHGWALLLPDGSPVIKRMRSKDLY